MGQSLVKGNQIIKVSYKDIRVLQKRIINDALVSDHDIKIGITVNQANRATVGNLVITFNKNVDWIIGNYGIGENVNKFTKVISTNSISKPFAINVDNNGAGNGTNYENYPNNYIYLSDLEGITSISISQSATGFSALTLELRSQFPSLKSYTCTIPQNLDFTFLASIPQIQVLVFQTTVANINEGFNVLKTSNLVYLAIVGFNAFLIDLVPHLPPNLYALELNQAQNFTCDLKDFFNGSRISFSYNFTNTQAMNDISYSGGAVFPSVISDVGRLKAITNIIRVALKTTTNSMNGNAASKLLMDFANQVTSVTLQNSAAKRIVFYKVTPNTAYTDLTQPTFTTYSAALNHITTTLGVSVTFNP